MAEGLNRAMLLGNLGSDPELRHTTNNRAVLKFRLATTETYLTEANERREVTHWHNIVLWGKRAEALSKLLSKGSRVYIEGRIETRSYEKDAVKRSVTEITASNLILLDRKQDVASAAKPAQAAAGPAGSPGQKQGAVVSANNEDIPPDDYGDPSSEDDIPF